MYDPTKVKVDSGHVREETVEERLARHRDQEPYLRKWDTMVHSVNPKYESDYERARRAGQVTYYELGRRSRKA
jgi:hypothetical protein